MSTYVILLVDDNSKKIWQLARRNDGQITANVVSLGDACKKNHWLAVGLECDGNWNLTWAQVATLSLARTPCHKHSTFPATNTREFKFCTQWVLLKKIIYVFWLVQFLSTNQNASFWNFTPTGWGHRLFLFLKSAPRGYILKIKNMDQSKRVYI